MYPGRNSVNLWSDVPGHVVVVIDEAYFEYVIAADGYPDSLHEFGTIPEPRCDTHVFQDIWTGQPAGGLQYCQRRYYGPAEQGQTALQRQCFGTDCRRGRARRQSAPAKMCQGQRTEQLERLAGFCREPRTGLHPVSGELSDNRFRVPVAGQIYRDPPVPGGHSSPPRELQYAGTSAHHHRARKRNGQAVRCPAIRFIA